MEEMSVLSQLYFWKPLMEKHKKELVLVEDYYNRTKSYFKNIEKKAENHANFIYENYNGNMESDVVAEWANEQGIEMYETLAIMKSNHLFMTVSMLYHIWEQQLRKFTIRELKHYFNFDKRVWNTKTFKKYLNYME
jgi:hypothetical protein